VLHGRAHVRCGEVNDWVNWQVGLLTGSSIPTISWSKVATAALVVVPDMAVVTLDYLA
jgi:hypothetical protein